MGLVFHGTLNAPYPDDPSDMDVFEWVQARNAMREASQKILHLQCLLRDQFEGWHDPDCKHQRPGVMACTCGHDEVKAALAGTEHVIEGD